MDNRIIKARGEGTSFCEMDYDEAKSTIDNILLSGAAITGAPLPSTEFFANFISKEVFIHLTEFGRGELTLDEVLLALRINSLGENKMPSGNPMEQVSFYGNCFNVDFLSKVLGNYMIFRNNLDRKLGNYLDGYRQ